MKNKYNFRKVASRKPGFPGLMRIAIFHNYMDNIGGAEYMSLLLARELNADIYTTNINKTMIKKMGFLTDNIYSIGRIPINAPFRQEAAYWRFRFLNVEKKFKKKYDFYIIAGDWAMSGGIRNRPHLWHVCAPTREIWDLYKYTRENIAKSWQRPIFDLWVLLRRIINKEDSKKIMRMVSISKNTQSRLKKYLKRNTPIVFPPTETKRYKSNPSKNYWLSVNRLITHKRVDLQLKAFQKLPNEKLIIVGSYEDADHFQAYAKYMKDLKPDNVEIKSWINEKELIDLYANCKGFITTSKDEDYGMNVVEAMASGKPVIGPYEGGYKETVTSKTGILIENIDENKIMDAIKEINRNLRKNPNSYKKNCLDRAKKFDTKVFVNGLKEEMNKCIGQN